MTLVALAIISTAVLLLITTLGGIGMAIGLFDGLTSIPPFVYILLAVVMLMWLLKGR